MYNEVKYNRQHYRNDDFSESEADMVLVKEIKRVPVTRQLRLTNTHVDFAEDRTSIATDNRIPRQLELHAIHDGDHMITVDISPMMVIGRKRSMRDYEVNIDLTNLNGAEAGVSRYHAMMLALDNHIYVKDIDSLNGSLLNGKRMTPSKEYILMDGDIVAFGKLELRVIFVYD